MIRAVMRQILREAANQEALVSVSALFACMRRRNKSRPHKLRPPAPIPTTWLVNAVVILA